MSEMNRTLAFVFPGQGSQSLGMIQDLLDHEIVKETLIEADEALGFSLSDIIKSGDLEMLGKTEITQPAILTVSIALWRVWVSQNGAMPAFLAGHSLGEYSALVAAGVLAFKDAVKLVHNRGQFMQEAVPAGTGAMAAILGLDDDAVIALCKDSESAGIVAAVNFNSQGQVVIAGEKAAVEAACELAKERGARRALLLPVSVPSHCILMKPAADRLALALEDMLLAKPHQIVIHNVDVKAHTDTSEIKEVLVSQLYEPVRWTETIEYLAREGVTTVVECGPGKVLTGLIRRIDKSLVTHNILDGATLDSVIKEI
nr:ACP S-malonyltransferase [Ignatzschineria rhizosphaerae]